VSGYNSGKCSSKILGNILGYGFGSDSGEESGNTLEYDLGKVMGSDSGKESGTASDKGPGKNLGKDAGKIKHARQGDFLSLGSIRVEGGDLKDSEPRSTNHEVDQKFWFKFKDRVKEEIGPR
jgi:hypothetical protein